MNIEVSSHARKRIAERQIPESWIADILTSGDRFFDTHTQREVAVKRLAYYGKNRDLMVVFEQQDDDFFVITVSALKQGQKRSRIERRRWI